MTHPSKDDKPGRGFIYAATGEGYTALARRSAETLLAVAPDVPIDLYTDQTVEPGPFAQIHQIDSWFRPKFEALARTRFDRAVYLDADTWVVSDPSDIFDVLDRFDVALAHDPYRASEHATTPWRVPIPAAFPQYNSGVIGLKKSDGTAKLMRNVIDGVKEAELKRDQGVLRELLYLSDLRIATLPEEYNLMGLRALNILSSDCASPRILHSPRLHASFRKNLTEVSDLSDLIGSKGVGQLERLKNSDVTLGGSGARVRPLIRQGMMEVLSIPLGLIRGRFKR